jgi:hypothetical protein
MEKKTVQLPTLKTCLAVVLNVIKISHSSNLLQYNTFSSDYFCDTVENMRFYTML